MIILKKIKSPKYSSWSSKLVTALQTATPKPVDRRGREWPPERYRVMGLHETFSIPHELCSKINTSQAIVSYGQRVSLLKQDKLVNSQSINQSTCRSSTSSFQEPQYSPVGRPTPAPRKIPGCNRTLWCVCPPEE